MKLKVQKMRNGKYNFVSLYAVFRHLTLHCDSFELLALTFVIVLGV
jgi:hypothetical protein